MRPRHLTLCGWGPYKEAEEVDFTAFDSKGIFLITGATGAGKTTIFDAISYALYGALSGSERDKERGSVRSDFADGSTPTFVELVMEHKEKTYRIRRNPEYLRPKKRGGEMGLTKEKENAILFYPDGRILEGVKEVNAAVRELLVLDYQHFKKISMIAQGEFARLLVAPPREKTQIFREIFDTGIYERFTQNLGAKARAAYAVIMEQRHKLEEDVRLLAVGLEKSGWSAELQQRFLELIAAESWDDGELCLCLEEMEAQAKEKLEESRKRCERAEKRAEKLTAELGRLEEENRRIAQLLQAEQEWERLGGEAPVYEKKQERYHRAMNAGWVESAEETMRQLERRLVRNKEERDRLLLCEVEACKARLKKGQEDYLARERLCAEAKAAYETAEHRRRLDAIGLAAELLEEGKSCPVCGSLSHPAPAAVSVDMISEAELKKLKKERENQEKELLRLHGVAASEKAKLDSALEQADRLAEAQKSLEEEFSAACEVFEKTLKEYGFSDRESFRTSKLDGCDRERLRKELEDYRAKCAAAEELYRHLQENVKGRTPADLTEKKEMLAAEKEKKEAASTEQRLWERHFLEVKKTRRLMADKLECVEEQKKQYGYIKDLENLASGNNTARLVFEQYVLAGYFEEILRAANLRFSKMTGGRYEMSRVPQVGDGRVKDNLEIQVLDFYTGKYRSVRTLSGGESFKASLALALGMSDVIQSINGGIRVDTLFVDEGFGALDEESLDQACDTLMGLVEKKHMIGIISHVPELRERIENQLIIEKTGSGSRIRCSLS